VPSAKAVSGIAAFILIFAILAKVLPLISVWEVAEEAGEPAQAPAPPTAEKVRTLR